MMQTLIESIEFQATWTQLNSSGLMGIKTRNSSPRAEVKGAAGGSRRLMYTPLPYICIWIGAGRAPFRANLHPAHEPRARNFDPPPPTSSLVDATFPMMRRTLLQFHWRPRFRRASSSPINRIVRAESSQAPQASRIDRITSKLPRRLQKYTNGLRNAPVSHVVSFMILHEITAIVPLLGLFGLFHYTEHVPVSYMTSHFHSYVEDGLGRFEKYFKRKG